MCIYILNNYLKFTLQKDNICINEVPQWVSKEESFEHLGFMLNGQFMQMIESGKDQTCINTIKVIKKVPGILHKITKSLPT